MTKASLTFYNIVKVGTDFREDVSQKKPFFFKYKGFGGFTSGMGYFYMYCM